MTSRPLGEPVSKFLIIKVLDDLLLQTAFDAVLLIFVLELFKRQRLFLMRCHVLVGVQLSLKNVNLPGFEPADYFALDLQLLRCHVFVF